MTDRTDTDALPPPDLWSGRHQIHALPEDGYRRETARRLLAARDERIRVLTEALRFYAQRDHFIVADDDAWDTVSGEPPNLWCDEAGTATVEDGSVARAALEDTHGR